MVTLQGFAESRVLAIDGQEEKIKVVEIWMVGLDLFFKCSVLDEAGQYIRRGIAASRLGCQQWQFVEGWNWGPKEVQLILSREVN